MSDWVLECIHVAPGALGGPVGEHIGQLVKVVEMNLSNRKLFLNTLAELSQDSKEVEIENAVLDEIKRVALDPELKKTLGEIDGKYEKKNEELNRKIDQLQEKFDERHEPKSQDEKQALQEKLDKQFEKVREQLEKAHQEERQRTLDEARGR